RRNKAVERLIGLYENASRPDLVCDARLKWTEFLEEKKEYKSAANGVVQTILKHPEEGRYVPKLLDRLKELCGNFKGGNDTLGKCYLELIQKIPPTTANGPNKYFQKLCDLALAFFNETGNSKMASAVAARKKLATATGR